MLDFLAQIEYMEEKYAKFYISVIILALEYLHKKLRVIHRDLKLDNVMLDANGYPKLCDFGLARELGPLEKAFTICGTPDYMAPEMITQQGYDESVDWWSVGILMFELLAGYPPFAMDAGFDCLLSDLNTYNLVVRSIIMWPEEYSRAVEIEDLEEDFEAENEATGPTISPTAKSLITKFLCTQPSERLGCTRAGIDEVKANPFFSSINFEEVSQFTVRAPLRQQFKDKYDLSKFDDKLSAEDAKKDGLSYVPLTIQQVDSIDRMEDSQAFDWEEVW